MADSQLAFRYVVSPGSPVGTAGSTIVGAMCGSRILVRSYKIEEAGMRVDRSMLARRRGVGISLAERG